MKNRSELINCIIVTD